MKKISIVIPVYNSNESLYEVNSEINKYFSGVNYDYEKIYVNDASRDRSYQVLKNIALKFDEIERTKVINLDKNVGQQNALFYGLRFATGDYIVTMDDDLQHNIKYLSYMLKELEDGYELVYGVTSSYEDEHLVKVKDKVKDKDKEKYREQLFDIRSFGSNLTGQFFRRNFINLNGKRVSSFRAFDKNLLEDILTCNYKFIYLSAIMLKHTDKVENVLINKRPRVYGKSGYNIKKLIILFLKLNFYYSNYSIEALKPKGITYDVTNLVNVFERENYEKSNDTRSREVPSKCY